MRIHSYGRRNARCPRRRRFRRVGWEQLEGRWLLAGGSVDITLDRLLDQFGYQPEISQAYEDKVSLGAIFDTGASLVSFSATDQYLFDPSETGETGIPIKVYDGAQAEGIGGILTGDVSQPGTVLVDGIHTSVWSGDIFSGEGGLYFDQIQGRGSVHDTAPSTTQFAGDQRLNAEDDLYAQSGFFLSFTQTGSGSSGNLGLSRAITDYVGATRTFTFAEPFPEIPSEGDTFHILVGQGETAGPLPARDRLSAAPAGLGLSGVDGEYIGRHLLFTSGDLAGESQLIAGYEGATHTFTFGLSFSQRPQAGDTFDIIVGTGSSAVMPGVQVFVGTLDGSEMLSTLGGTPMLNPTFDLPEGWRLPSPAAGPQPLHPAGLALKVGPQNLLLDLGAVLGDLFPDGMFDGITMPIPSVEFREPGTQLEQIESFHAESTVDAGSVAPTAGRFAGGSELPFDPDHPESFQDFYVGFQLRFLTGELADELQEVSGYDAATRTFTFAAPFSEAPAAGDLFELVRLSTTPVTLDMELIEFDNHTDPGEIMTVSPNPVSSHVRLAQSAAAGEVVSAPALDQVVGGNQAGDGQPLSDEADAYNGLTLVVTSGPLRGKRVLIADYEGATHTFQLQTPLSATPAAGTTFEVFDESAALDEQVFLFDTGAQLSVISTAEAEALGLDPLAPEFTTSVQGAGGVVADLPGYLLDELSIPTREGGRLTLRNAPVYVLDVAPMLDGILGMNLFNSAAEFLYDPFNPASGHATLQVTFFEERAEVAMEADVSELGALTPGYWDDPGERVMTQIDTSGLEDLETAILQLLVAELMPVAFGQAVGLREIGIPSYGVGVGLGLTPQGGVLAEEKGVTVVTVAPDAVIPFTAQVRYTAESYDAFVLDFAGSDPALHLRNWVTGSTWTAGDGTLAWPGDSAVSAQGEESQGSSTLGTFVVDAPHAPGDYVLTADDALDQTEFSLTGVAEPRVIRDFGHIVIRVQETPTLSISDAALVEGADGTVTNLEFTVALAGNPRGPVSVEYATENGSASAADGDYTTTAGTVQFAVGQTQQTITVPVHGDANPEDHEKFSVDLSHATMDVAPLVLTPVSDVTAINLDGGFFEQLEADGESELHADAGSPSRAFALEFDLDGIPSGATINSATLTFVETTDTVDPGILPASVYGYAGDGDGVATLANPFNVLLSDLIGSMGDGYVGTESLDVTAFFQSLLAGGKRFAGFYIESSWSEYYIHSREATNAANRPTLTLAFSSGSATVAIAGEGKAWGTIRNDDTEISISDRQQAEGDAGQTQAAFVVQLSHPSAHEVTVHYATSDATATGGEDYQGTDGVLVLAFAPGETAKAIQIPILGDPLVEPDETFVVSLSAPQNATLSAGHDQAVGTISNDDVIAILSLAPTPSGFVAEFSGVLDTSGLNLYDGAGAGLGAADVTVTDGAGQTVPGSLVIRGGHRAVEWVATGSALPAGTYTAALHSGATAFRDLDGNPLDGDADGTTGGNFLGQFTVATAGQRVLSLPDTSRGAGQTVNIPNTASGLPIRLDHAAGVTSLAVDVVYDKSLLQVTGVSLANAVPDGWTVTLDTSTPGVAKLTASGTAPLSGTNVEVVRLTAAVPSEAPYGASQAIRLDNVSLNGGALAAVGDVAVHKAVYMGDADGSGIHSSADAFLTVQAALGLASGFAAHAWTDPRIVGDADGSGVLSAADAFLIVQEGLGLPEPFVPDNPHLSVTPAGGAVDPQFRIGADLVPSAEGWVSVPVNLAIEPAAANVGAIDFDLFFDPAQLAIQLPGGVSAGADTDGWAVSAVLVAPGQLRVGMVSASGRPLMPGLREIARLQLHVAASLRDAVALDIEPVDPRAGGYTWTAADGSVVEDLLPDLALDVVRQWHCAPRKPPA